MTDFRKRYFADEHQEGHNGIHSIVDCATKRKRTSEYDIESFERDTDYHLLGATLFNSLTREQQIMTTEYINESMKRVIDATECMNETNKHSIMAAQTDKIINETMKRRKCDKESNLSLAIVRRRYIEGIHSVYTNMPVPIAKPGGTLYNHFAIVSVEQAAVHLLAHGDPLKSLDYNEMSDWKDNDGRYHSLFHQELFNKINKIENRPEQLLVHQIYIWSDGFQKNTLVKRKATSLQLFIIYFVPQMVLETSPNTQCHWH